MGHDLTIRNSEETIKQKAILLSMIPAKQQGKYCSENIGVYIEREEQCFFVSDLPDLSRSLDHLAQYKEYRLLLLYHVIINYLSFHVKLNFNDPPFFCIERIELKAGCFKFLVDFFYS